MFKLKIIPIFDNFLTIVLKENLIMEYNKLELDLEKAQEKKSYEMEQLSEKMMKRLDRMEKDVLKLKDEKVNNF